MSTVLDYAAPTNSLTINDNGTVTSVAVPANPAGYTWAGNQIIPAIAFQGVNGGPNGGSGITPTLSTSTTGGSIAASTTTYYYVVPVFDAGPNLPPSTTYSDVVGASIETGSSTSTNSNTLSWSAYTDAVSYNIYSCANGEVGSYGYIGNTTALTFTDTGISPGALMPGVVNSYFQNLPISNIIADTANGWQPSSQTYKIPVTGWYSVITSWRVSDGSQGGISCAINGHTSIADTASDHWFVTAQVASGQSARNGSINAKIAYYEAGEEIYIVAGAGAPMVTQACELAIAFLGS